MLQGPRKTNEDEEEEEEDPDEAEERQQQMQLLQNEVKSRTPPRRFRPLCILQVCRLRLVLFLSSFNSYLRRYLAPAPIPAPLIGRHPQCGGRASSRRRSTATCGRTSKTRTGTWASASTKTSRPRRGSTPRPSAASTSAPQSVRARAHRVRRGDFTHEHTYTL